MANNPMKVKMAQLIGEPIIVSILVRPYGDTETLRGILISKVLGKILGGAIGGLIRGAVSSGIQSLTEQTSQDPLQLYPEMILAITSSRIALFELKVGLIRNSIGELVLIIPRSNIVKFAIEKTKSSLARGLVIQTQDDRKYELETPLSLLPKLRYVVNIVN